MRTNQPGHLSSFDYLGLYRYFLTFCTDRRHRFFIASEAVDVALPQILRAASECELAADRSDCREFIKKAKQYSGFYFSKARGQRLWQRYGCERVLRSDEATLDVARYILKNPLRAGLVADVREYPFLGSSSYALEEILDAIGDGESA